MVNTTWPRENQDNNMPLWSLPAFITIPLYQLCVDQWEILKKMSQIFDASIQFFIQTDLVTCGNVTLVNCFSLLGACLSKVPKLFGSISDASIRFWAIKLRNSLVFSYLKNMLKDQLFKTSRLKFDNWLFGPRVLGSLDKPLRSIALRKLSRANQSSLRYSASHWGFTVLLYFPSHRKPLFNMEKRLKAIWQRVVPSAVHMHKVVTSPCACVHVFSCDVTVAMFNAPKQRNGSHVGVIN